MEMGCCVQEWMYGSVMLCAGSGRMEVWCCVQGVDGCKCGVVCRE